MAAALESVVKQLTDSGIISQGKLENFVPPKAHPASVEELISELVKQNHLPKFQAQAVTAGKAKSLIMGEYTLLDRIGAGGMGQVFKAEHRRMKRLVAIKMLPPTMTKDAAALARFQREVEAAAKLDHPNVVPALDAGQAGNLHFLVMQYVEGQDLSVLVKKNGPLPVEKAVNYILQAARGLEFAHGEGVIHRDIKPANLLLDKKGVVKILDMGLARISTDGNAATQAELTGTGAVMGTVDYMAPEQAMSTKSADGRADIYSLGCSLYYLLVGSPVFDGETITAKLVAHQFSPVPSLEGVPEAVEAIFQKMVAKKIEDRYQTMADVIADLQPLVAGGSTMMVGGTPGTTDAATSNSNLTFLRDATVHTRKTKSAQPEKVVSGGGSKNKKLALIGAGVVGVIVLLAAIIVSLRTKDGTLIVEVDQPDATVQVLDEEGKVEVSQKGGAGKVTISVDPGKHRLKVEKNGFAVFGQAFEIESGGEKAISAKLVAIKAVASPITGVALGFDGQASHVNTSAFLDGTHPFTIEAWVTPGSLDVQRTIVSDESKYGFSLHGKSSSWHMACSSGEVDVVRRIVRTSTSPVSLELTHVAGSFDGREIRLHINGVLQGATPCLKYKSPITQKISIGCNPAGNPAFLFDGIIDEVRISKVARYTGNFKPKPRFTPDADTIALYHFDEGSGDTAYDSSENKHHAKIVGAKWVSAGARSRKPLAPSGAAPPLAKAPFDAKQARAHQEAWAKHLGIEVETPNSVGAKMVLIPPGEFLMGSTDEQAGVALKVAEEIKADQVAKDRIQNNERPQHRVVITKPLLMSATEVTVGQFRKFVEASKYVTEAEQYGFGDSMAKVVDDKVTETQKRKNWRMPGYVVSDESPVAQLTWTDAVAYCQWLSTQEKATHRLPTEAEWEYACRAGTNTQYSFSDDYNELPKYGWHNKNAGNADGKSYSVAALLPNNFGLFDMHGNLYEWCGDYYDEKWYSTSPLNDPIGPSVGSYRVIRGGVWSAGASYCRSASRSYLPPSYRSGFYGFRIVRELAPSSTTASVTPQPTPAAAPAKPITDFNSPEFQAWMKSVQAMPAKVQIEAVSRKLVELNSGFDGNFRDKSGSPRFKIENDVVTELGFSAKNVTDVSPVRALTGLKVLMCSGNGTTDQLFDLSPLRGMALKSLTCFATQVSDLSPLEECKDLTTLVVTTTKVTAASVAALQKALPNCNIQWDDPAKAKTPQPTASGTK